MGLAPRFVQVHGIPMSLPVVRLGQEPEGEDFELTVCSTNEELGGA